ncbi:MAG: PilZ domain-containing protein [Desulfuromonadaceae bacterium]|nr:PilZ domain-containing protein [Desulfuromonadaceae bacterium]
MHNKKRSDERFTFISEGQMDINGTTYNCLVDNISTSGALIEVTAAEQEHIRVGETGILNTVILAPVKFLCKVVRINLNQIGLQFVGNLQR